MLEDIDSYSYKLKVINPCDYYNFSSKEYNSEREVKNFDQNWVRKCDMVIVDFLVTGYNNENNPKSNSQGTTSELTIAGEMRKPIIGLNQFNAEIHPWDEDYVDKMFIDTYDMCEYIKRFYLR